MQVLSRDVGGTNTSPGRREGLEVVSPGLPGAARRVALEAGGSPVRRVEVCS